MILHRKISVGRLSRTAHLPTPRSMIEKIVAIELCMCVYNLLSIYFAWLYRRLVCDDIKKYLIPAYSTFKSIGIWKSCLIAISTFWRIKWDMKLDRPECEWPECCSPYCVFLLWADAFDCCWYHQEVNIYFKLTVFTRIML